MAEAIDLNLGRARWMTGQAGEEYPWHVAVHPVGSAATIAGAGTCVGCNSLSIRASRSTV